MIAGEGRDDCGAATIWVVIAIGVVMTVAAWCVVMTGVGAVRARAGAAADLAALAGAARLVDVGADPCSEARRVAAANAAQLRRCVVAADRTAVEVTVDVQGHGVLSHAPPARSRARAGPSPP